MIAQNPMPSLNQLNLDIVQRRAGRKVLWQPRILCYFDDREFLGQPFPAPYTGLSHADVYRALGCSNRPYFYTDCFRMNWDKAVVNSSRQIDELTREDRMETPVGVLTQVVRKNTSNSGVFPVKWWVETEADLKVLIWLIETAAWTYHPEHYDATWNIWGDLGLPQIIIPRVSIQSLMLDWMGTTAGIYATLDFPDTVDAFFRALDDNHMRMLELVCQSGLFPFVNYGDNIHGGVTPPSLFTKYILPSYERRTDRLHKAGIKCQAHWDGDVKPLLPYAKTSFLDGIEAITPLPQGDVTVAEMKAALGDEVLLLDGLAAVLFEERFPLKDLRAQFDELMEAFAGQLILGISDEISSVGDIHRVRLVSDWVNEWNAKHG